MKSKDLAAKAGISTATLAKMKKAGATVSSDVLVKICTSLPQPMAKAVPCSFANLTGATQELRIEGVDFAAARYHVIDRERLPCVGLSLDIPFEL